MIKRAHGTVFAYVAVLVMLSLTTPVHANNVPAASASMAAQPSFGHVDFTNLPWLSMLIASGLAALGAGVWTLIEYGDGRIEKHEMFFKMFVNVVVGSFAGVMVYALMSWWRAEIWQTFLSCCGSGLAGRIIIDKVRGWAADKLTNKGGL